MGERMSDERLAEIEADLLTYRIVNRAALAQPLLQALKAEREEVGRLRSKLNTQEIAEGRAADLEYEPTEAEARLTALVERLKKLPVLPITIPIVGRADVIIADSLYKALAEATQGRPVGPHSADTEE